ncbi:MAG TPA: dephospho-CoA kinase [Gammaproteobacteria bacterium]
MLVIGLTGGIGSGKTTVSNMFRELGIEVIDADEIARCISENNTDIKSKIKEYFGTEALDDDGNLDRKYLRSAVFDNEEKRIWLEKLLHPLVINEIKEEIEKVESEYCVVSVPLLFESGSESLFDRILVVDLPEMMQLQRATTRDESDRKSIEKIAKSQISRKERLSMADDIIDNNEDIDSLKKKVIEYNNFYLGLCKSRIG